MADYNRGSILRWSVSFVDQDGDPYNPSTVNVIISYPINVKRREEDTVALIANGDSPPLYEGDWDSNVSLGGKIYWAVYASAPDPKIAKQGNFTLGANPANLAGI